MAPLEFAGMLMASMRRHSATRIDHSGNEVKDIVNRWPQPEVIRIEDGKSFHESYMQGKAGDVRCAEGIKWES